MQWGGRDSSRSLAVRNAEFATSLRQHVPGRKQTKHRCPSRDRQRTPVARRSVSPQKGMGAITNPFTGTPGRPQDYINRREMQIEKLHSSSLQQELDESMSELAIVQRRCHSLEESLTIAEAQHVKARNMNARLKERLQLFQEQNAENCRIAEMEISKLTARLTSAETTIGRLQDENNALDEAVRAQANELKFLKDVEARLEAERDEAFRGGQKLEESLRELAQDFETVSDQLEREKREAQTAKLQLEELMEASLGQAEKLEKVTTEMQRIDALELVAADFREKHLLRRWLPCWRAAQRLARASRCVAHSVRRGSQARLCAVVLRSWRNYVRVTDQLMVMLGSVFDQWRRLSSYRGELTERAVSYSQWRLLLRWLGYWQRAGLRMRSLDEAHRVLVSMRKRSAFRLWCRALWVEKVCATMLLYRQRSVKLGVLMELNRGRIRRARAEIIRQAVECEVEKRVLEQWQRRAKEKVRTLQLGISRQRLCRIALEAFGVNRLRGKEGRRTAELIGRHLRQALLRQGICALRDVLGRARSAEKCRLALRVLRLRGRQGRLKRHGTAAVMMQRRKVLRSTMLKWTTAASRARYIRQVCEHLMSRRSLRLLRQTLLGWVLHLLGCSVTIKERNNEDRLQQALQKTASLRSLLHSQEERIAALETGEEASVTRIKRLKSKLDARDDEIDRLRRDVQLLEEINHKLRLTSVLEPLTDTVITSPIASDVTSRSLAPSEYSSNGLPSDVGSRAVPLLQLESIE